MVTSEESGNVLDQLQHTRMYLRRSLTGGRLSPSPDPVGLPTLLRAPVLVARSARGAHVLGAVVEPVADMVAIGGSADAQAGSTDLALMPVPFHDDGPVTEVGLAEGGS